MVSNSDKRIESMMLSFVLSHPATQSKRGGCKYEVYYNSI